MPIKGVKTRPRETYDGASWLVLLHDSSRTKVPTLLLEARREAAMCWWLIEMRTPLAIIPSGSADLWLVPDNRRNSMNFRWMCNKAKRYASKIYQDVGEL